MKFSSSLALIATALLAQDVAAFCKIKFGDDDCCWQSQGVCISQKGGGIEPCITQETICSDEIKKGCDADCCSLTTEFGIGCPK